MDPLAQLQDIQLPDKIHNYPIAMGWWVLALICIALIVFISIKIINHKKIKRSQQQAITQLTTNEKTSIDDCVKILKWAALAYFPRENIANLYGENFYEFLLNALPEKQHNKFKALSSDTLQTMYQKNISTTASDNFHKASLLWLKHALPPKNNTAHHKELSEGNI